MGTVRQADDDVGGLRVRRFHRPCQRRKREEHSVGFWSIDGSLIATASFDGTITIREGDSFEPIRTLVGSIGVGNTWNFGGLMFSPDNRFLLTNLAGPGRLWDVATGEQIGGPFPNLVGVNPGGNYSENGLHLVTGSENGTLIWNLDVDTWPEIACRTAGSNLNEDEWEQWGPRDEPFRELCP